MLLFDLIDSLFQSIYKNIIRNRVIFSNLYAKLHTMSVELIADVNIIIDAELVTSNQSLNASLNNLD